MKGYNNKNVNLQTYFENKYFGRSFTEYQRIDGSSVYCIYRCWKEISTAIVYITLNITSEFTHFSCLSFFITVSISSGFAPFLITASPDYIIN